MQSNDTHFGFDVITGNKSIGAYIQEVVPNSPAYRAGLRKSDRIMEIDDKYMDKTTYKSILEKLNKAVFKRTIKLLVLDTKTYAYSVLKNPGNYS